MHIWKHVFYREKYMFDYTNILNLHEFQIECSEGRYNIPIIKTEKFIPDKLIDFCHSLRSTQFPS